MPPSAPLSDDRSIRRSPMRAGLLELAPWIALAALWVAFVWIRHGGLYAASDDSYIYLGYVKRALTPPNELFSYNPGEHSAGTTSMLYYYVLVVVCGLVRALASTSSLEADLLRGLFLANVALLLFGAHVYLRCWRHLTGGSERIGALALSVAFLLFCVQPKWLWAVFAGMEGPLAACLALLLLDRLLERRPAWQVSLVAALLVVTRPETLLVVWTAPALAVLAEQRRPLPIIRLGAAYAFAGAALVALVLPCYALTGRVLPSSLGTRVELAALVDPAAFGGYLRAVLGSRDYWMSEWWLLAGSIFLAGVFWGLRAGRWSIAWLFGHILAFLALRATAGLAAFNVEDRYVSYIWPLYALGIAACVNAALPAASARAWLAPSRRASAFAWVAAYAVAAGLPARDFLERVSWHVGAMNAVVVEPSRWMRAHLPPDARVCMEPAGAIRVFTDFYLVDVIGLTTIHATTHAGNFPDFLYDHRVDFVFDRPDHVGRLLLARRAARDVAAFGRGLPWGDVHVYEVDLSATIAIATLWKDPAGPGRARAVFDNNALSSWSPRVGGGSGFAGGAVAAEFAQPALVDTLTLALSGVRADATLRSHAFRFEGKRDGRWARLATKATRTRSVEPSRTVSSFALAELISVEGIQVVHEGASGERAPAIDELTLLNTGRPYVWLWDDSLGLGHGLPSSGGEDAESPARPTPSRPPARVAQVWASAISYFSHRPAIGLFGKSHP